PSAGAMARALECGARWSRQQRGRARARRVTTDDDEQKIKDEMSMMRLLCGFRDDEDGVATTDYPAENSPDERQCREVLAKEIRARVPGFVGELLALAIDPD